MSLTIEFYETRAKEAGSEADDASLDNVRDRALRSQAAWQALADRASDVAEARARKERNMLNFRLHADHEEAIEENDIGYE